MNHYTTPGHEQIAINFRFVEFVSVGSDGQARIHFVSGAIKTVTEPHARVINAFELFTR